MDLLVLKCKLSVGVKFIMWLDDECRDDSYGEQVCKCDEYGLWEWFYGKGVDVIEDDWVNNVCKSMCYVDSFKNLFNMFLWYMFC